MSEYFWPSLTKEVVWRFSNCWQLLPTCTLDKIHFNKSKRWLLNASDQIGLNTVQPDIKIGGSKIFMIVSHYDLFMHSNEITGMNFKKVHVRMLLPKFDGNRFISSWKNTFNTWKWRIYVRIALDKFNQIPSSLPQN